MSLFKQLVRREILARRDLVGTVLVQRELRPFNAGGSPVWACDVDVGGNRILRDVPIKGSGSGQRFFAERGQTVLLRRNKQGRYDVVGPADTLTGAAVVKTYVIGNVAETSTANQGFDFERVPFEFYEGTGVPGGSLWNDGTTPFPLVRLVDADGNPI